MADGLQHGSAAPRDDGRSDAGAAGAPAGWLMRRGPSARLAVVLLICLAPAVAAAAYVGIGLRGGVDTASGDLIARQAELAAADMSNVIYAAKQLTRGVAQFASVRAMVPACATDLAVLQPQVPRYAFIAVLDAQGAIVCSSRHERSGLAPGMHLPWAADMRAAGAFAIGLYTAMPGGVSFLPIEKTLRDSGQGSGGAVVAAIDLHWLAAHMARVWLPRAPLPTDTSIVVADRDGTILTRYPDSGDWLGRPLPEGTLAQIRAVGPGNGAQPRQSSEGWLAATAPPTAAQSGLATIVLTDGDHPVPASYLTRPQAILLFGGAACLGLALAAAAGRRILLRPMHDRLRAAEDRLNWAAPAANIAASHAAQAQARAQSNAAAQLAAAIAAREAAETALRKAQRLQAVGRLSGGIAHDFNNMLATIMGCLELMERRIAAAGADPGEAERLQALIDRAIEAVQRGARLTTHLTAVSRRQRYAEQPTDLNRLIADLAALAGGTLGRGLRIDTEPGAGLWPALVDASLAEAAIIGLCLAAREAMPATGRVVIATGNIATGNIATGNIAGDDGDGDDGGDGDWVGDWVGVTLRGPRQAMDLDEVRGLARACGGGVRVVGTPGQDIAVTLLLRRAAAPDPSADRAGAAQATRSPLAGVRVMVVDDDPAVREVTAGMLRTLGCEPVEASCADHALALLDARRDDVRLMMIDYAMPGRNGIELLRAVRDRGLAVPAMLVTGHAEVADGGGPAPDGLLRKPFTTSELHAALARLLALAPFETLPS